MDKKRRSNKIMVAVIFCCYIIYNIFWLRAAMIQANTDSAVLMNGMTQIANESTIRNLSELLVYVLFLIFCWNSWDDTITKKYFVYLKKTGIIISGMFVLGIIFSVVQYLILDKISNNYMIPVVISVILTVAVLMLASGKRTKNDFRKKKEYLK